MQDEFSLFSSLDWRFGGFLAVFVIAVVVEITAIAVLVKDAKMSHLVMLCVFPFVIALPIFVIACDWGRFLFVLMTQSLLVMLSDKIGSAVSCSFPAAVHRGRVPFQPLMEQCFLSFRRAAERHPWLFCFVLAMLSIPATPFGFTILRTNPVIICGTFIRHFSQIVHP
jgi:hypothetical protein